MKIAFLYAGQGSQKPQMGMDLYETYPTFAKTIDGLANSEKVKYLMFQAPQEELTLTHNTQPAMAAFAAGVTAVLTEAGIGPQVTAGLSLGEYSALHCAGVWDANTLVELVAYRGQAMEEASQGVPCKMSAVMGLDRETLQEICGKASVRGVVEVSNYNCTGQYVIAGESMPVDTASAMAKEAGAKRVMSLQVSGPFHTSLMKPAGEKMERKLSEITLQEMNIPVLFNRTARELQPGETIQELLVEQVSNSIYMEDIILRLKEMGVDTVVEIGPGKVLSGFIRRTTDGIKTYVIENAAGMEQVLQELQALQ